MVQKATFQMEQRINTGLGIDVIALFLFFFSLVLNKYKSGVRLGGTLKVAIK